VGVVGFCIEDCARVVGTPYGMMFGSVGGTVFGASRGAYSVGVPVGFPWVTIGCRIDRVALVGGIENLTLWLIPVLGFRWRLGLIYGGFGGATWRGVVP
jgi:hypothetical protein